MELDILGMALLAVFLFAGMVALWAATSGIFKKAVSAKTETEQSGLRLELYFWQWLIGVAVCVSYSLVMLIVHISIDHWTMFNGALGTMMLVAVLGLNEWYVRKHQLSWYD